MDLDANSVFAFGSPSIFAAENKNKLKMFEAEPAPGDCPTAMKFAPGSRKLLVSSMDGNIYMYELQVEGEDASAPLVRQISIGCPVLDVTFGSDDKEGFCTGADSAIKRYGTRAGSKGSVAALMLTLPLGLTSSRGMLQLLESMRSQRGV